MAAPTTSIGTSFSTALASGICPPPLPGEAFGTGVLVWVGFITGVSVTNPDGGVTVGVGEGPGVVVFVGVGLGPFVAVAVGVWLGPAVGVLVGVIDGPTVGLLVGVGLNSGVAVGVAVGPAVGVADGAVVGVADGTVVAVGTEVRVLTGVTDACGVTVGVAPTTVPVGGTLVAVFDGCGVTGVADEGTVVGVRIGVAGGRVEVGTTGVDVGGGSGVLDGLGTGEFVACAVGTGVDPIGVFTDVGGGFVFGGCGVTGVITGGTAVGVASNKAPSTAEFSIVSEGFDREAEALSLVSTKIAPAPKAITKNTNITKTTTSRCSSLICHPSFH